MIHAKLPSTARLLACVILTTVIAQIPAFAQSAGAAAGESSEAKSSEAKSSEAKSLPKKVEQKLKDQGFTNVQVVPGSFLVSAKDKDGDPVTMVIGPRSMTVFTVSSEDRSTTGSGKSDRR